MLTFVSNQKNKMSDTINITLYLGRPDKSEIEEVEYSDTEDFMEMCEVILSTWQNKVYLVAAEQKGFDQILIEDNADQLLNYLNDSILKQHYHGNGSFDVLHMGVWIYIEPCYESAFKLALSMKEPTGLSYETTNQTATESVLMLELSNKN